MIGRNVLTAVDTGTPIVAADRWIADMLVIVAQMPSSATATPQPATWIQWRDATSSLASLVAMFAPAKPTPDDSASRSPRPMPNRRRKNGAVARRDTPQRTRIGASEPR